MCDNHVRQRFFDVYPCRYAEGMVAVIDTRVFDGYQTLIEKKTAQRTVLYDIGEEQLKENG